MIRIRLIDHVVLRTSRVQEMIRFYTGVLGCELERSLPAETGLYQLRAGQSLVDLVDVESELGRPGGEAPGDSGNNMDHFCLQIEHMDEEDLKHWLGSRSVETGEFATRYGARGFGRSLYLQDPDGNTVELTICDPDSGPSGTGA